MIRQDEVPSCFDVRYAMLRAAQLSYEPAFRHLRPELRFVTLRRADYIYLPERHWHNRWRREKQNTGSRQVVR